MKITFLGTKGNTNSSSELHKNNSCVLLTIDRNNYLFGYCKAAKDIKPIALFLTHSHEHAVKDLKGKKIEYPVYMSQRTDMSLSKDYYPLKNRKVLSSVKDVYLRDLVITPINTVHSITNPTNGYVIRAQGRTIGYFDDVLILPKKKKVLRNMDLLIIGGNTISDDMVKEEGNKKTGIASMNRIFEWSLDAGVEHLVFTNLGDELIESSADIVLSKLRN